MSIAKARDKVSDSISELNDLLKYLRSENLKSFPFRDTHKEIESLIEDMEGLENQLQTAYSILAEETKKKTTKKPGKKTKS